jgi:hypothetical protein
MMTLTPGRAGYNELTVMYFDADGDERDTEEAIIRLVYLDYGNVAFAFQPTEFHPGHILLEGPFIPHEGSWRIEVAILRRGLAATNASFDVVIR